MVPALATEGNTPMAKLSDTQAIILSAAAQRPDGNVLPLPGSLRGGAAIKVVTALLSRGLIREQVSESITRADPALNTIWRNDDDGRAVLLRITPAGLDAIGVEPRASGRPRSPPAPPRRASPPTPRPRAPTRRRSRFLRRSGAGTRRRRPRGATRPLRARPAATPSRRS